MKMFVKNAIYTLAIAFMFFGCDSLEVQGVDDYVVEAYLIEGEEFPIVRLSRTAKVNEQYDFTELAVTDATTRIDLLDGSGNVESTVTYSQRQNLYWPDDTAIVQAGRTYRLTVDIPGEDESITATTLVPGAFAILEGKPDSVLYQSQEQFAVNVTESAYPGRQAVYIFSVEALEPSVENLTPFYREVVDPGEDGGDIDDVIINESFVINEANFEQLSDGTFSIKLPWLAVAFYGTNNIVVNALDDNLYDFSRSFVVQQGGSTLSPGEIPNVIDHIDGAAGIFGSISRQSVEVVVLEGPFQF